MRKINLSSIICIDCDKIVACLYVAIRIIGFDAGNPSNLMSIEFILKYGGIPYYWVKMVNRDEVDSSIIKKMKTTIVTTI